jgi:hypothetical protein
MGDERARTPPGGDRSEGGRPPPARGGRPGRATRRLDPASPCLNCGDPTPGEYCPSCGQRKTDVQVSIRAMAADALEDELSLDRRLPSTLMALLFRPGKLTVEYVNGRIVRYVRPFRLYLVSSVVFFLLLSFTSTRFLRNVELPRATGPLTAAQIDSAMVDIQATLDEADLTAAQRDSLRTRLNDLGLQRLAGALGREAEGAAPADPDTLAVDVELEPRADDPLAFLDGAAVNMGHPALDSAAMAKIRTLRGLGPRQALERLVSDFLRYVPTVLFVLLPFFAGVLKLFYIRRRRFYAEHFIFLLHTHALIYLLFTVILLTVVLGLFRSWFLSALFGWLAIYTILAMRRMYGQGWIKTLIKWWLLAWTYIWVLTAAAALLFLVTALLA